MAHWNRGLPIKNGGSFHGYVSHNQMVWQWFPVAMLAMWKWRPQPKNLAWTKSSWMWINEHRTSRLGNNGVARCSLIVTSWAFNLHFCRVRISPWALFAAVHVHTRFFIIPNHPAICHTWVLWTIPNCRFIKVRCTTLLELVMYHDMDGFATASKTLAHLCRAVVFQSWTTRTWHTNALSTLELTTRKGLQVQAHLKCNCPFQFPSPVAW